MRTGEQVLVNPRELDVCLGGVGNDEDVDDLVADNFCHRMSEDVLYLHR